MNDQDRDRLSRNLAVVSVIASLVVVACGIARIIMSYSGGAQ